MKLGEEVIFTVAIILSCFLVVAEEKSKLILVQTVFRHGARAPTFEYATEEANSFFYRGLGHLTDVGYSQARTLGALFRDLYANTSFLDSRMLPDELSFTSSNTERCVITAQVVGNMMFPETPPAVATTSDAEDYLLKPHFDCPGVLSDLKVLFSVNEEELAKEESPIILFVDKAIRNAYKDTKHIKEDYAEKVTALIIEKENGLAVPSWFNDDASREAQYLQYHGLSVMSGTGPYHRASWIRTKAGFLLYTIFDNINQRIKCISPSKKDKCAKMEKFIAYSTHDIVLLSLLEALGTTEVALGRHAIPDFCATLIVELWLVNNIPAVKIVYRRHPNDTEFITLTDDVTNCIGSGMFCNASNFTSCCQDYVSADPKAECWGVVLDWSLNALSWALLGAILLCFSIILYLICLNFSKKEKRREVASSSMEKS